MAPTPAQTNAGYHAMWDRATIDPNKRIVAENLAKGIIRDRARYQAIEKQVGVPWYVIAPLHTRESSRNFSRHMHNGDPLTARTRQVPKGRPAMGIPPFSFEQSAADALATPPHSLQKVKEWSVERILYESEKYNGWGYLGKGNSPYIWSWTNLYKGGKYIADHVYSTTAIDPQPGVAAILKELALLDPDVAAQLQNRQAAPPADVDVDAEAKRATERDKKKAAGGAVIGGGSGATKASTEKPSNPGLQFAHSYALPLLIAVGIAVVIWFSVKAARKAAYIKKVW